MLGNQVHVMAIGESWLKPKRSSNLFQVPRYNLHRASIHRVLHRRPLVTAFLLLKESTRILMWVVCNPPPPPPNWGFSSKVEEAILNCNSCHDFTILVGNVNINWRGNSTPRRILANSLSTCGLTPLAFSPTHNHRKSHSTIDFTSVSDASKVTAHEQQCRPHISENDTLLTTLDFSLPRPSTRYVNRRSFRHFNVERFQSDLASISYHDLSPRRSRSYTTPMHRIVPWL